MEKPLWLFFPDYRLSDPYQTLLARALAPVVESRSGNVVDALENCAGRRVVFHLHWEDGILAGASSECEAGDRVAEFLAELSVLHDCGACIIWTRHNAAPHDDLFPAASAELRRTLARQADILHVHGEIAAKLMREDGGDSSRMLVLRNPDIGPFYPDDIDDAAARRYFDLCENEVVFACLGAMRSYKGIEVLLQAFASVHTCRPEAQLIMGGRQANSREGRYIMVGPGVRIIPHFVDDGIVQYVLHAADFVVAPYHSTLTPGAVALALGFGRPVIVPDLPAILEIVRADREAFVYRVGDKADLARVMQDAFVLDLPNRLRMREAALRTARAVPFAELAQALMARIGYG